MALRSFALLAALIALAVTAAPAAAHDTLAASTAADRWQSFDRHALGLNRVATAAEPHPLTGAGEGLEVVANVPVSFGSDLELHGNLAFVGSYDEGLVIIDISDPTKPARIGKFDCGGGSQYDVQLHPEAKYALLTTDGGGSTCHKDQQGSMVLDVSDPTNPREIAFIPIKNDKGGFVGSHTHTLDWPYLYVNNYPTSYHKLEVFTLADPAAPKKVGELDFGEGESSIHDSWVDHRPDGRTLLYAASITATDAIDVTDPSKPKLLQRVVDPEVTISHQAEPNPARDTLVVTDEFNGGGDAPACGQVEGLNDKIPVALPEVGDPSEIGAVHFYALKPDGTIGDKTGTFNLPTQENESGGCTSHVYWKAPDQERFVIAWYGRGVRVVDYADPANPIQLAYAIPEGANTWAAKPHNGYIYTGDVARGFDVLRFTGEGWPKTAGPAEADRLATQRSFRAPAAPAGTTPATPTTAPARGGEFGARTLRLRVRMPRAEERRVTLRVILRNRSNERVATRRFRVRPGRVAKLKLRVAGRAGLYRWYVRAGGKRVSRGRLRLRGDARISVRLPRGRSAVMTPTA